MTQAKTGSARRLWAWAFCALLLVLALGIAAAWIWRKPLVSWAAETSCAQHGLICRFELKQVSLDRITADGVSVSARNGETPLAAERLSLDLVWDSPISPRLTALSASAPRIRAAFDGQNFSLYGLEEALPRGNGDATPWPRVDAAEGQLEIETPAGPVSGSFNLALTSREDATAQLTVAPANLETETGRLVLASGIVDLTIQNGTPGGVADLEITTGRFGAFSADSALLRAEFVPGTREGEDTLRYRLAARELALNGYGVQAATSSGDILLALHEGAESGAPLTLISGLIGSFEADALTAPGAVAERVNLEIDLARNTAGGIEGPVGLTADQVHLEGQVSASDWVLTGTARQTTTGELNLDGRATARAIALAPQRRGSLAATVSPRSVFPAHGAALETAIERGLARFDTGLTFSARRSGDGRIQIRARGPLRLTATSGLRAGLLPFGETAGLIWQDGALTIRGALSIEGGGAPHLVADLNELSQRPEGLALNLTDLTLSPWQEDELTLSAGLSRLVLTREAGSLRVSGQGTIGLDGRIGALDLDQLTLFGAVDGARGREGWRAQLGEGNCLGLASEAIGLQSIVLDTVRTRLCPPDGRLIRQGPEGPEGMLMVDPLNLDLISGRNRGRLNLPSPTVRWTGGNGINAELTSEAVQLDLSIGARDVTVSANLAELGISLGRAGGTQITSGLQSVDFGGSLIPAQVSAGSAQIRFAGGQARGSLSQVRIADTRSDPLYQPVLADLEAELAASRLHLSGPIRLERSGRHIADAELNLAFPELNGGLNLTSHDLTFRPGGLQLSDLSERLRGYFTNTRGRLDAQAEIAINGGGVTSRGNVTVGEFGFQTVALGRVTDVNGAVVFEDLFKLTSPPAQTVTIGAINPGLPLTDGEVKFQLTGGGSARLESALWPFAGGVLAVQPTSWEIGAPSRRLTVRADRIRLAELTELLQMPGFSAEGTVSGRFPIEFSAGNAYIRDARLAADAAGGTLRYTGDVGARAGQTNENVALAFRALRDFRFTVLEIGADGNLADDIVLSARLQGHNPDVLNGQGFNFNVSVDSKLGQLLSSTRQLTGTDWLAEIRAQQAEAESDE